MAVNGIILDQFVDKKVKVRLRGGSSITGILTKENKKYFLNSEKLTISKIVVLEEME